MRALLAALVAFGVGLAVGLSWNDDGGTRRAGADRDAAARAPARGGGEPGAVADAPDPLAGPTPPIEVPEGDGVFTGRVVLDGTDRPLEGVLVVATPEYDGPSRPRTRAPGHPPYDDMLADRIAEARWRKAARKSVRTGADGRFRLAGLARCVHVVRAYREGYEIRAHGIEGSSAEPDAEIEFRATRVVRVEVVVRGAEAMRIVHLSVRGRGSSFLPWRPADRYLELEPGRYTLKASGGSANEYASDEVAIDVRDAPGQRVELTLEGAPTLRGKVSVAGGLLLPDSVSVACVPVADRTRPPTPREFLVIGKRDGAERGTYRIRDLEPGEYFVAVQCGTERIHHLGRVTVDGVTAHDIVLDGPDRGACVLVRALGPDGNPPRDWRATLLVQQPDRGVSGGSIEWPLRDGSRLVQLPAWKPEWGAIDERTRFRMQFVATGLGEIRAPCELGGETVVRFREPASLRVTIDGWADHPEPGALSVTARQGETIISWWKPPTADGVVEYAGLQPEPVRLALTLGRSLPILQKDVPLEPGENAVRLAIPPMHPLAVTAPGLASGQVWVRVGEHATHSVPIDADGVAKFELPAGEYEIGYENERRMTVRIPDDATATLR